MGPIWSYLLLHFCICMKRVPLCNYLHVFLLLLLLLLFFLAVSTTSKLYIDIPDFKNFSIWHIEVVSSAFLELLMLELI